MTYWARLIIIRLQSSCSITRSSSAVRNEPALSYFTTSALYHVLQRPPSEGGVKGIEYIAQYYERHRGVSSGGVDKYNGNAVLALFGGPINGDQDTLNAMTALLEITSVLEKMESGLSVCVGITTSIVVAGNLGSSNRMNYSVIGDAENPSARLESLMQLYNVSNIGSEASKDDVPNFAYRELEIVCVVGKSQWVRIFELLGIEDELSSTKNLEIAAFTEALKVYGLHNWGSVQEQFSCLQVKCDNAQLSQVFVDRIENFRINPPGPNWQGRYVFGS